MIYNSIMKVKNEIARLYGDTAKQLKEGQTLKVVMDSIEGRTIAVLVKE